MRRLGGMLFISLLGCEVAWADLLVSRGTFGIDRYADSGTFLGQFISPGTGGLNDARGIAIGSNGDVYVADFLDSQILRFDSAGTFLNVFSSGAGIQTPFDLSFGPGGDLYVGSGGNDAVVRVNALTGMAAGAFTFGNPQPIGGPHYLAFGPQLVVTDQAGRLFRFNAATGAWIQTTLLDNPEGAGFNAAGDLFVAQRISDNVLRSPSGGGPFIIAIPTGDFAGAPADLVFGPGDLMYLATSSAIYRFDVSSGSGALVDSFGNGGEYLAFTNAIPEPGALIMVIIGLAAILVGSTRFRN
ncbi:MAG TPA: hypothetical protein VE621_15155 [Bryobacteraceae bacterium]|nr:hypothetical protein [Bryobacteraceae bacterium]